jgi:hypothetical protein
MVLINLDTLYDDTLYDYQGCFKQWALNKYLSAHFMDNIKEYWTYSPEDEERLQKFELQRHNVPDDSSVEEEVEIYIDYCKELLFSAQDHAWFYCMLLDFGLKIELECQQRGEKFMFPATACLDIANSFINDVDFEGDRQGRLDELQRKIEAKRDTPALQVIAPDLKKLLQHLGEKSSSDRGARMMEFRMEGTKSKMPVANIIFFQIFRDYLNDHLELEWPKVPAAHIKDYPAKFQGQTLVSLVTNPLRIVTTFEETRPNRRQFVTPLPEDFPACRPDLVQPAQAHEDVKRWRQHIFSILFVNDCLVGYRGYGVDLRQCRDLKSIGLQIPQGGTTAFWSRGVCDFNSKIGKRDRPRGVWIPAAMADQLQLTDQNILQQGNGIGVRVSPEQSVRADVTKEGTVRFSNKVDVVMIPTDKLSTRTTKPTKTSDKPDPKEAKDNKNLTYIVGAVLAFSGLFLVLQ